MSFKLVTRKYTVDLSRPEEERWLELIQEERKVAKVLVRQASQQLNFKGARSLARAFVAAYTGFGGRYTQEMDSWAKALGVSAGEIALIQCSYELAHAHHYAVSTRPYRVLRSAATKVGDALYKLKRKALLFGCTAGIRATTRGRMHHVRTMDWPIDGMAAATRIIEFKRGKRSFVTVGMPGMVGVLSGMLPGAYSVTINMAPPHAVPSMRKFGALFLLRETLEECDTYQSAVARLARTPISAAVFFVVCGSKPDQGCVIERTQTGSRIRRFMGPPLVQANHYETAKFRPLNALFEEDDGEGTIFEGSQQRATALANRLDSLGGFADLQKYSHALSRGPVGNADTAHRMAFCPGSGRMAVWARVK